jgi:hypothetical protein
VKKSLIFTLAGLSFGIIGICIGYLFLKSLNDEANNTFLLISAGLLTSSIACLFLATNKPKPKTEPIVDQSKIDSQTAQLLTKNTSVITQWNKNVDTQDKLKILKMVSSEEENKPG